MRLRDRTQRIKAHLCALVCALTVCEVCSAQDVDQAAARTVSDDATHSLRQVEEGVADMGPLRTSTQVQFDALRLPSGFDRVYQLQDGTGRYARASGALVAVFERSDYVMTREGLFPVVPDGTVFYIGNPTASTGTDVEAATILRRGTQSGRAETLRQQGLRSSLRAGSVDAGHRIDTLAADATQEPSGAIMRDLRYRSSRIVRLLEESARQASWGTPAQEREEDEVEKPEKVDLEELPEEGTPSDGGDES